MNFHNTTAIITGGTGALGSVVAEKFFDAGANIAIPLHSKQSTGRLSDRVIQSVDRCTLMQADLSVEEDVKSFIHHVLGKFGSIGILANIAGGYAGGTSIVETPLDQWDSMMTKNLRTTFLMSREVLKPMIARGAGRVVNIAAMPALASGVRKAAYAISKRGVVALTETLAEETKASGVTVNAIAPSIILTDDNKQSMPNADFSKWVTTDEIAELILFLCSERARSISGNVVRIFGGL